MNIGVGNTERKAPAIVRTVKYNRSLSIKELFRLAPHAYFCSRNVAGWLVPIVDSGSQIFSLRVVNERFLADVVASTHTREGR